MQTYKAQENITFHATKMLKHHDNEDVQPGKKAIGKYKHNMMK